MDRSSYSWKNVSSTSNIKYFNDVSKFGHGKKNAVFKWNIKLAIEILCMKISTHNIVHKKADVNTFHVICNMLYSLLQSVSTIA